MAKSIERQEDLFVELSVQEMAHVQGGDDLACDDGSTEAGTLIPVKIKHNV